jgi:hypothetical protein
MKYFTTISSLLAFLISGLMLSGCASNNVNPTQPRADTGYVDFRAESADELSWEVERFDARTQEFKRAFSELDPVPGGVLRLAFTPGRHRLRVGILNRVVRERTEVELEVRNGMVTPVVVALTPEGTTLVERKEERRPGTAPGQYGRANKYSSDQSVLYRLSIRASAPLPYLPKERMPYAR